MLATTGIQKEARAPKSASWPDCSAVRHIEEKIAFVQLSSCTTQGTRGVTQGTRERVAFAELSPYAKGPGIVS